MTIIQPELAGVVPEILIHVEITLLTEVVRKETSSDRQNSSNLSFLIFQHTVTLTGQRMQSSQLPGIYVFTRAKKCSD